MSPETKKTLIYGGVISLAVGVGLYIYSRYEDQGSTSAGAQAADANAAQAAQAQAEAVQQETDLAALSELGSSGGGGEYIGEPSTALETPTDNFGAEVAQVLQAAGLAPPANTASASAPPQTNPTQPTQAAPPAVPVQPVGPVNGGTFSGSRSPVAIWSPAVPRVN